MESSVGCDKGMYLCDLSVSGRTPTVIRPTLNPERESGESLQLMCALVVLNKLANSQTSAKYAWRAF